MSMAEKVVNFGIGEVYSQIEQFLELIENKNKSTADKYRRGIELFFETVKDKDIRYLTLQDIQLTYEDFQTYVNRIKTAERKYANSTINGHITSVAELLRHLNLIEYIDGSKKYKYVKDISFIDSLKRIRLPREERNYDPLYADEIKEFAEWVLNNEKIIPDVKYHMIRFALETCLRIEEILSLKWDDFYINGDFAKFRVKVKNNKYRNMEIKKEHFDDIIELMNKYNFEYVFNIGKSTMNDVLKRWIEVKGGFKGRYIVFHSIRKGGAMYHYDKTKDITYVQKILGHEDVKTTLIYLRVDDYGATGAISAEYEKSYDLFEDENVTKQDLLNVLREMDSGFKVRFNEKLKNIIKNKD